MAKDWNPADTPETARHIINVQAAEIERLTLALKLIAQGANAYQEPIFMDPTTTLKQYVDRILQDT